MGKRKDPGPSGFAHQTEERLCLRSLVRLIAFGTQGRSFMKGDLRGTRSHPYWTENLMSGLRQRIWWPVFVVVATLAGADEWRQVHHDGSRQGRSTDEVRGP